jgi:uncharacterized Fe-S cluster-containing MiaB family protein
MEIESEKKELVHCIYSSAQTIEFSHDDIIALLEAARKNNSKLGVTGILLYDSGSFFQILEGEPDVIQALYKKIENDKRHCRVSKIIYEPIESRSFSEWTMGYAGVTREKLRAIDGLNDFFYSRKCYTDLDEGRAKMLLIAFKEGKWRASIS